MSEISVNELPYTEPQIDPLESLRNLVAFSARDWGKERDLAWVFGIVLGWGDPEVEAEFRVRFGWTHEQFARLQALHVAFEELP